MPSTRPLLLALALAVLPAGAARSAPASLQDAWRVDPLDEPVPSPRAHFLVGNEARHDLFTAAIAGRGGAYLGVGGDQNYTLIAAARSSLAFILDHDARILELHRELGRRIQGAPDPASFLRDLDAPPPPTFADVWPALTLHLRRVATRRSAGAPTTWLGDPALYAAIRERWRAGAIRLVLGDLTGDTSMPSIAAAATSRGLAFTVVYLSNVDEALASPPRLADNLAALPRSPGALVLHTRSRDDLPAADGLWSYAIEPLELAAHARDSP